MKSLMMMVLLSVIVSSCAANRHLPVINDPATELPSINSVYSARLSELNIGMSLQDFRSKFSEAIVAGQSGATTAYELSHSQQYILLSDTNRRPLDYAAGIWTPNPRTNKNELWFYFFKNQLVQWGKPRDWPQNPDLIIENRSR